MSAFMCENEVFDLMASIYAKEDHLQHRLDHMKPHEVAEILYHQNCRSLGARYGDSEFEGYTYKQRLVSSVTPQQIIKTVQCYSYQACETDDYYTTKAYLIACFIIENAVSDLTNHCEIYDRAQWGCPELEVDPKYQTPRKPPQRKPRKKIASSATTESEPTHSPTPDNILELFA